MRQRFGGFGQPSDNGTTPFKPSTPRQIEEALHFARKHEQRVWGNGDEHETAHAEVERLEKLLVESNHPAREQAAVPQAPVQTAASTDMALGGPVALKAATPSEDHLVGAFGKDPEPFTGAETARIKVFAENFKAANEGSGESLTYLYAEMLDGDPEVDEMLADALVNSGFPERSSEELRKHLKSLVEVATPSEDLVGAFAGERSPAGPRSDAQKDVYGHYEKAAEHREKAREHMEKHRSE